MQLITIKHVYTRAIVAASLGCSHPHNVHLLSNYSNEHVQKLNALLSFYYFYPFPECIRHAREELDEMKRILNRKTFTNFWSLAERFGCNFRSERKKLYQRSNATCARCLVVWFLIIASNEDFSLQTRLMCVKLRTDVCV